MQSPVTPTGPLTLLTNVTATGSSVILPVHGACKIVTIVVQGNGTISAGTLVLEEAYFAPVDGVPYPGTWSALPVDSAGNASIDLTDLSGGAQQVFHYPGSMWAVRARLTDAVTGTGGSVTVTAWGN